MNTLKKLHKSDNGINDLSPMCCSYTYILVRCNPVSKQAILLYFQKSRIHCFQQQGSFLSDRPIPIHATSRASCNLIG